MKKLLVVDDSESIRNSLKFSLGLKGYNVLTAAEGEEALRYLKADPEIGLLITDLQMPGMDGKQLLKAIRSDTTLAKLPVIVLTAEENISEDIFSLGATAMVMKSAKTSEEVHHFVQSYLKL